MIAKEKLLVAQDKGQKQRKNGEMDSKNTQTVARQNQVVSSPSVKKPGNSQSARVTMRLDSDQYATGIDVQKRLVEQDKKGKSAKDVYRPGNLADSLFKTPNYVSDFAMSGIAGMANSLIAGLQDNDEDVKAREAARKALEQQKAALDKALNDLYQQMEGYKNNGQTDKVLAAEQEYADINKRIAQTQAEINGISSQEAAVWEAKRYGEIMSTGDGSLMYNLRRLVELKGAKMQDAGLQGDDRRSSLTESEIQYNELYNSLKSKYGDQVNGWIAYVERMGNKSAMAERMNAARRAVESKPFWTSLGSAPLNMFSGAGYLDVIGQNIQRSITGSDVPIDYNSPAQSASKMANTIRGTVSEDMGGVGKFLYNTGMSMADTLVAMPMGSFGMAMLGGSAATNAMQSAIERGASDGQALKIGLAAGAIETVMEKLSIDSLFGLKSPKAVLNVMKQAGVEGTEEGLTTIANTVADAIIMGDKSELNTTKRAYMANGYSPDQAEGMALKEWGLGLLTDVAGGMLSGGVFGSTKTAVSTYGKRNAVDARSGMTYDSIREELDFERQFMDGFNAEEELDDGEERLYLRNGSQWDRGPNSGGTISAVETGPGRDQGLQAETAAADGGTAALSYGQKVSAASLGIPGGSAESNIRIVTGGESAATRAAMKTAKDNGLQLTLFTGGNLQITNESGKTDSVRGYISGDKVFVRADHPTYTADQIMRHEAGHARIARGEIDARQIRERIRHRYGIKRMNELSGLYTTAYAGSGLNADEIWEEVVCDSLGDMNIFRELRNGRMVETVLHEVRAQAETGVQSARGPPTENMSVLPKMSRGNWHSNLPKRQMIELCEWVKRDIRTSENRVSDTANWAFRMYNGAPEFSIYSTQDPSEPTILYAVKGAQAEYERTYLEKELERIGYGRSIDGESRAINIVLSGSWLLDTGSTGDSDGTVGRERSSGDAEVLRKSSRRKPSAAFESVLRNLLQAEIEGSGGKYSRELGMTPVVEHRNSGDIADEKILRQMEALKAQYRKLQEDEELEKAFLHGFNMEE